MSQKCDRIIAGLREVQAWEICSFCGRLISEHKSRRSETCDGCGKEYCEFTAFGHQQICKVCGETDCYDDMYECADCGEHVCWVCSHYCVECSERFCEECYYDHECVAEGDGE